MPTTKKNEKKRAGLYGRVSTANHGQDVGLQIEELETVAEQRGWQVVGTYIDEGVSGTKHDRPALDRMLTDVRAGKIDVVAVWRFDRFARSTQHLIQALEEFDSLNVEFFSLREQIDTSTAMGRAMFTIVSAISQLERSLIQERVQAGVNRAKAKGIHCGRPVVDIDVRPALAMLREGRPLNEVANILGVARNTLRRRLIEAGEWPVQKPNQEKDPE